MSEGIKQKVLTILKRKVNLPLEKPRATSHYTFVPTKGHDDR